MLLFQQVPTAQPRVWLLLLYNTSIILQLSCSINYLVLRNIHFSHFCSITKQLKMKSNWKQLRISKAFSSWDFKRIGWVNDSVTPLLKTVTCFVPELIKSFEWMVKWQSLVANYVCGCNRFLSCIDILSILVDK